MALPPPKGWVIGFVSSEIEAKGLRIRRVDRVFIESVRFLRSQAVRSFMS
jgi:hypothetical protein